LVASLGYSLGFLIVVLGRQQLFTENTLTAIVPLLAQPRPAMLLKVLRIWAVVLVCNIVGAFLFVLLLTSSGLFSDHVTAAFAQIGREGLRGSFGLVVVRGVFAGWLIALMVWLLPAAEAGRVQIIIIITYVVALGQFAHIIAGSVDVLYLVHIGTISWITFLGSFFLPTLLGNCIGGVSLVAILNYAQVAAQTPIRADR
jgi:formate/nitrite transporter FocA (FNT family)